MAKTVKLLCKNTLSSHCKGVPKDQTDCSHFHGTFHMMQNLNCSKEHNKFHFYTNALTRFCTFITTSSPPLPWGQFHFKKGVTNLFSNLHNSRSPWYLIFNLKRLINANTPATEKIKPGEGN
jgi:hypothetical protein